MGNVAEAYRFGGAQPKTRSEKANVAHAAMGNDRAAAPKSKPSGKFHSMSIDAASNGVKISHRVKHFRKNTKEEGASDHPTFEDMKSTDHVLTNDHPMMKHVNALHEYCADCDED